MNTEYDDIDRNTVRKDQPDEWDCETLLHLCTDCARLSRGLNDHVEHYKANHSTSIEPTAACVALPSDRYYFPYDGRVTVEAIQDSLTDGNPANELADIVG